MSLKRFTQDKPKTPSKKEILQDNQEIKITQTGNEVEFHIKKKQAINKYLDMLFFAPTNSIITDDKKEAEKFFNESLKEGVEGLMFKNLQSPYKPGLRSGNMAKYKETKEDIDVVILAAEHGKGKRAGYYSSFIIGVKDSEKNKFLQIGKVSSGIKELGEEGASLEKLTSLLKPLKIKEEDGIIWLKPKIILQVRYQEIQKSPSYDSGYALRFPRIIMLREDKPLSEINTIQDIKRFAS